MPDRAIPKSAGSLLRPDTPKARNPALSAVVREENTANKTNGVPQLRPRAAQQNFPRGPSLDHDLSIAGEQIHERVDLTSGERAANPPFTDLRILQDQLSLITLVEEHNRIPQRQVSKGRDSGPCSFHVFDDSRRDLLNKDCEAGLLWAERRSLSSHQQRPPFRKQGGRCIARVRDIDLALRHEHLDA